MEILLNRDQEVLLHVLAVHYFLKAIQYSLKIQRIMVVQ